MSEQTDSFEVIRAVRRYDSQLRREQASKDFPEAREMARVHGMMLVKNTDSHYTLKGASFLVQLYPSTFRIVRQRGDFALLEGDWGLLDVVKKAIRLANPEGVRGAQSTRLGVDD